MNHCPCGSNRAYEECCEPVIKGARSAATAEELMRARYSAYVKVETDFIFETTHPEHRKDYDHEGTREWAESAQWQGLEILGTKNGGPDDRKGEVEFVARYLEKGMKREHHETAEFVKEDGTWLFTDAVLAKQQPLVSTKIGRNEPCPCGSGQKYKKCCGK